jgi:peptidoglycan/LPS O-acetylase OafA/YrhL
MTVAERSPLSVRDLPYVGGVDGLRALAVSAVILFHFSPGVLPAGFLGVDVFFVVSGFLISRLVVRELSNTGELSMVTFWARRARRLLPALVTVTAVVVVAVAIDYSSIERNDLQWHALGSLFYSANWVFIGLGGSYFATVGRPSPFLHMWSLAIEEQFYVIFPIVCYCFRGAIVRHPLRASMIALAGAVASSVWMYQLVDPLHDPSRAYLGTDSHAMGLLIGVALGILAGAGAPWDALGTRLRAHAAAARGMTALAVVALVGVVLTMRWADGYSYNLFRGGFFVFSLACGLLIVTVTQLPESPLARFLSLPFLIAIGLRAYSLYLWHWPVRVFITPHPGFTGFELFAVRLIVSVALAEVSYRFVERPFRFGKLALRFGSKGAVAYFAAGALLVSALAFTVALPDDTPPTSLADLPQPQGTTNANGSGPSAARVDMFGDSTALVYGLAGSKHAAELDLNVAGDARLGCGIVTAVHMSKGRIIPNREDCSDWQRRWLENLDKDPDAALLLMAGAWDVLDQRVDGKRLTFGDPEWSTLLKSEYRKAMQVLTSTGRTLYVMEVPCYGPGDPAYPLPERGDQDRIDALNQIIRDLADELDNVEVVPWRDLVCPGGKRAEEVNGVKLWETDKVHLTDAGAVEVWKWWLPRLRADQ